MDSSLIDRCLEEISKEYRPGLLPWLKQHPDRWRRLLQLEDGINKGALGGDQVGLTAALSEYKGFFGEMVTAYEMDNALPLFRGRDS